MKPSITLDQAADGMREALLNVIKATHGKMDSESSFLYRLAENAVDIYNQVRQDERRIIVCPNCHAVGGDCCATAEMRLNVANDLRQIVERLTKAI